jgi:hypothetical protein
VTGKHGLGGSIQMKLAKGIIYVKSSRYYLLTSIIEKEKIKSAA